MWLETKKARNFNAVVWVLGEVNGYVVIDDTLAPRCSVDAPGAAVRFDHAAKTNRPAFLLCQGFVTLSAVVPCRDAFGAAGQRPVPQFRQRRQDRHRQG